MICPFCLEKVKFKKEVNDNGTFQYVCPEAACSQPIPRLYVDDYKKYPPVVVSIIGHRAHGKTVALSTLYYTLARMDLGQFWPEFYMFPINDPSLEVVFENAKSLDAGKLPPPNPKIFPEPTLLQVNSLPITNSGKATLLFYDTAGEAFMRTQDIGRYAGFVRRADTALFLVSMPQLKKTMESSSSPGVELERLLYSYIQGMADMNADTRKQHLIIVFTCGDAMLNDLEAYPQIKQYMMKDDWDNLRNVNSYVAQMYVISDLLYRYAHDTIGARQFLTLAKNRFASVHFSIISALGAAPDEAGNLSVKIKPRRILDPLLWTLERSQSARKQRGYQRHAAALNPGYRPVPTSAKQSRLTTFWKSIFK